MDPVSSLFRRASRATPWRATEEALDAFHMEGGGPPPPKKTVEKVLSFELKVLAQPPGSAAGLPCEAASAKNGSRPPNEEGEYPISNKEYPTSKCFGLKVKDSIEYPNPRKK